MGIELLWSAESIIGVQRFFGASWSWFFKTLTILGTVPAIAVVFAVVLWIWGRELAYGLLGIILWATFTNVLIWTLFPVARPHDPQIEIREKQTVPSFPSGHTVTATTLWGTLAAFDRIPIVVAGGIVAGVMLSRLYLGVHYPVDLLGGVSIGLILVLTYQRLWFVLLHWFSGRPFRFFLILGLSAPVAVFPFTGFLPQAWEIFGAALGMGIGMPLEYWYVHYSPDILPFQKQMLKLAVGLGGLAMLVLVPRLIGIYGVALEVVTFAIAALWIVFLAPALFVRMKLSSTGLT
ncbi:phosphatase PAP2 family protein [Coleofasciculus sp. FACHB-SPT9]|uniref:phosphatase PAP2 family protein n=1 Tax=Cyanophyceae TaxID=3028117 RepID=UPI0016864831|nr:phosphatase PAP2 family protein [Coleofasciculus sp. FACHB-SPT9]MBD1892556.1 phosphatase PAP2 family protein [Coleofasciculus sp. FACHB-SPT9]